MAVLPVDALAAIADIVIECARPVWSDQLSLRLWQVGKPDRSQAPARCWRTKI